MSLTIQDLDFAFDNIWLSPGDPLTFIDTWKCLLNEFLSEMDIKEIDHHNLADKLDYWSTMIANREQLCTSYVNSTSVH